MANPNPVKRGPAKEKPFRDALRMEIAAAGDSMKALRKIAKKLLTRGYAGDMQAIKEIADRMDGKVPQAIVGDDEYDPIRTGPEITDEQRARALALLMAKQNIKKS